MRAADHLVDLGPGAGEHGGHVIAEGTPEEVAKNPASLTGQYLSGKRRSRSRGAAPATRASCVVRGAREHNLKASTSRSRSGVFCCVTGVSGSGKSTLVNETLHHAVANRLHQAKLRPGAHDGIDGLDQIDKIINIDQSPIGRTPRSNPATYTGVFDHIRQLFAQTQESRARGYKPGRFCFNVKGGRCEVCQGDGQIKIEMHFLPDVYVPCEQCHGKRYNRETLEVRFKGKSIADVLEMSVEEAVEFFENDPEDRTAGCARCTTSASTTSASASRRRRSPAARRSGSSSRPSSPRSPPATPSTSSTSRRPACTSPTSQRLLDVLGRLVDAGNTVVVIEHNLDVIKTADWLIDLGPEGGEEGGEIVATGTPEEVAAVAGSYTGHFLAEPGRGEGQHPRAQVRAPARARCGLSDRVGCQKFALDEVGPVRRDPIHIGRPHLGVVGCVGGGGRRGFCPSVNQCASPSGIGFRAGVDPCRVG